MSHDMALTPQNPAATKNPDAAPRDRIYVADEDRYHEKLGPDYGVDDVDYPFLNDREFGEVAPHNQLKNIATLTDWYTHSGWENHGGWNHSHHKFIYPGNIAVPVYAEPVDQHVLYLKTQAYYNDTEHWRDGQNPMIDAVLYTEDLSRAEFDQAIIDFCNAAYPYTRRLLDDLDRPADEPDFTDTEWINRGPRDAIADSA